MVEVGAGSSEVELPSMLAVGRTAEQVWPSGHEVGPAPPVHVIVWPEHVVEGGHVLRVTVTSIVEATLVGSIVRVDAVEGVAAPVVACPSEDEAGVNRTVRLLVGRGDFVEHSPFPLHSTVDTIDVVRDKIEVCKGGEVERVNVSGVVRTHGAE